MQACHRAWLQVQVRAHGDFHDRARGITYARLMSQLEADFPGETLAAKRRILQSRAEAWSEAYNQAKDELDARRQAAQHKVLEVWLADLARHASDPEFQPALRQVQLAVTATFGDPKTQIPLHSMTQFVDDITSTQSKYYMCRDVSCRHYGPAWHWFMTSTSLPDTTLNQKETPHEINAEFLAQFKPPFHHGHYKCPLCFKKYQPWAEGSKANPLVPASHVMVLKYKDPETGQPVESMFLTKWPDTITQNLEDDLKVVYNNLAQECAAGCITEIMSKTVMLANKGARSTSFTRKPVGKWVMDQAVQSITTSPLPWRFRHLPMDEKGRHCFDHAKYEYKPGETVILEQSELILFWGYTAFLANHNQLSSRL